ncbi:MULTISPECIES: hypothetical protein [unclassified Bartonella]|uniref:hypothetical protein n=1 Tax=unclassified Bartonella TaxID=2645622 RepID=UPI002361BCE5|nr:MULTISPECIES: hypothetical protein [unclassified Bartonella]
MNVCSSNNSFGAKQENISENMLKVEVVRTFKGCCAVVWAVLASSARLGVSALKKNCLISLI